MNKIGVYLHIPFCRKKCLYCDFYSGCDLEKLPLYEKNLIAFLHHLPPAFQNRAVSSVYLGGGTPSLLSEEGIKGIFSALGENFAIEKACEITSEVNPESASQRKLFALRESGVNRISIGMQSAVDSELEAIGRIHRFSDTEKAVKAARREGFSNLSLDLIYALPGQTMASWQKSVKKALSLCPAHLSLYCLTLSEKVPLYQRREELLPDEEQREMYFWAIEELESAGFEHYEISNAALPGFHSRHNERYWQREEYLGIGPGAHSFFAEERFSMEEELDRFISGSSWEDRIVNREKLSAADAAFEMLMLSLRTAKGLDLDAFEALAGKERRSEVQKKLQALLPHGLCRKTPHGFALTKEGFFVSNELICELI